MAETETDLINKELSRGFVTDNNLSIIHQIFTSYQIDTNLQIALYDGSGKVIWGDRSKFSPICEFFLKNTLLRQECESNHEHRTSSAFFNGSDAPVVKRCHCGLYNISLPIFHDGFFYGSLITGQVKLTKRDNISKSDSQFNLKLSELKERYEIHPDAIQGIKKAYSSVKRIENFDDQIRTRLLEAKNSLVDIIEHTTNRIKKINLLRHELHDPNITVRGTISKAIDELRNQPLTDGKITFESDKLDEIINTLVSAKNNSYLFTNIIENIFTSLNLENVHLNIKRCNMIKLLFCAMKIFFSMGDEKNVKFEKIKKINLDNRYIYIDRTLIMRVLINVYQNAVKYSYYGQSSEQPRTIQTVCSNHATHFQIKISNYGIGILPEEIEKIFEENVRGLLSSDKHRTGSGLGLYQVKKIIEAHRGSVTIESILKGDDEYNDPYLTRLTINLPYYFK
ncbi:PocR ligand-binding domain-containing protein [Desulfocicer niacini]